MRHCSLHADNPAAHDGPPAAFELQTSGGVLRYASDEVFAAASTFGGRWRVTGPDGAALFSLAPSGPGGGDDRLVVPHGGRPLATIMRDRRHLESWVVLDDAGDLLIRATHTDAYEVILTDSAGLPVGRLWATATAVTVDFGVSPAALHCVALALPLYFASTGALRHEVLDPATVSFW